MWYSDLINILLMVLIAINLMQDWRKIRIEKKMIKAFEAFKKDVEQRGLDKYRPRDN